MLQQQPTSMQSVNPKDMTPEQFLEYQELIRLEQMEEHDEFREACRVANNNLWLCDDGAP